MAINTTHLFFSKDSAPDPFYACVRDDPSRKDDRNFVEELWQEYAPYAEPEFLEDAKRDFHAKIWEMYLACVFLKNGFQLQKKTKKEGPDICLLTQSKLIWIEAIAPGSGTGADAVPGYDVSKTPKDKVLLRFTSAIIEKHKKYQNYIRDKIISTDDTYIIAVNGGIVPHAIVVDIVSCLFSYGNPVVIFDKRTMKQVDFRHEYRDTIKKSNDAPVSTNIFEDETYNGISAVLYSVSNVVIHPKNIGTEIQFVLNHLAKNKLPLGIFPFGRECWMENDGLKYKKWG